MTIHLKFTKRCGALASICSHVQPSFRNLFPSKGQTRPTSPVATYYWQVPHVIPLQKWQNIPLTPCDNCVAAVLPPVTAPCFSRSCRCFTLQHDPLSVPWTLFCPIFIHHLHEASPLCLVHLEDRILLLLLLLLEIYVEKRASALSGGPF